jgi:release factor glutamine methyltransferase
MPSLAELLRDATAQLTESSPSAQRDAEVLMCHLLGKPRSFLFTWPEHALSASETAQFYHWVEQRRGGQPVAYLTGRREFFGHEFLVSPDTLIPRPDTELLVESVLARIPTDRPQRLVDLGTGTGAIAISLALACDQWQVDAVDFQVAVLDLVQRNVSRLGANNVRILQSNWCDNLSERYDAIVSNPPYIAAEDKHLQQGDVRFEPATALVAGADGLDDIRKITQQAHAHLNTGGLLAFEHGYDQGAAVTAILSQQGFVRIETLKDYADHDRVTLGYAD